MPTAKKKKASKKAPWKRARPAGRKKTLSSAQKTRARRRAKKAGRSYPNLVDNMRVAAEGKRGGAKKRSAAQKQKAK